jgi:phenylpyruvate tautomerase PptA (4-oxalocrotonate tautomerase family)
MPWVNVVTMKKLGDAELQKLNAGVTAALVAHAGKQPQGVYLSVSRPEAFFWGQEKRDDSAIFEVRWIGEFGLEVKRTITLQLGMVAAPSTRPQAVPSLISVTSSCAVAAGASSISARQGSFAAL